MTTERTNGRPKITAKSKDDVIREIARKMLFIETLEERKSDDLDFHNVGVWCVRNALEAAYEAGKKARK